MPLAVRGCTQIVLHLLDGLPREGAAGDTDVWSIPVDGEVLPVLYLEHAWSPSVVRP